MSNSRSKFITVNIDESKTTCYDSYTIQDLIFDLKDFNPDAEILNKLDICWGSNPGEDFETSKKNAKGVIINYNAIKKMRY